MLDNLFRITSPSRSRQLSNFAGFYELEGWFKRHQQLIVENWYLYSGLHNLFLRRFEAEQTKDFISRVSESTIENHIKPIIDLICSHLYRGGDSVKRYVKRGDKLDEELMSLLRGTVWNHSLPDFDDKKALNTLVTGYTIVQRHLMDVRTDRPFSGVADPITVARYGYISKKLIDSSFSVPLPYIDENGLIDTSRLGAVLYIADHDNFLGSLDLMKMMGKPLEVSQVMEYVDDKVWLKFVRDADTDQWRQVTVNPGGNFQNRNQYGDVRIPFTVYKNVGDPFYVEGDSEVAQLRSLNLELNELANGDRDTIRYHQYPILVGLEGAKLPENFVRTKNAVIEIEGKGSFQYLVWTGNLGESSNRQESIRRSMSFVSGISLISRGFLKDIGQIRSGPPLKALFTSDRASMARRFAAFRSSEIDDMKADVRFFQAHTGQDFKIDKNVQFLVDFDTDFLGIDKLLDEEIKSLKIQSGSETIEEILREEHPEWEDEKIHKAVSDILKQRNGKAIGQMAKSPDAKAFEQREN